MKLTDSQLVLFDEAVYEQKDPVAEIVRGTSEVISYSFSEHSADSAYVACRVRYNDPKKGLIQATYQAPSAPEDGPLLEINEQVASIAEAQRLAKKRLREKNKEAAKASIELDGNVQMVTGVTILITGWKNFDGKYIITSAKHSISSGYQTSIEIRKVLEGY
ncbi:phage late control D family protein [Paenibacillus sp. TAB 01]|uniref:phage late control D family protein n=1 Tax=Paenibacillus sp. TAB 01 TaxID=3368988 RepID=UPI003751773D